MTHIEELSKILKLSFFCLGARIDFLAKFLVALLMARSVFFPKIAEAFIGKAKIDSHDNRTQRFFKSFDFDESTNNPFCIKSFPG